MNEHQMETRRRSRSKTPFLRSTCDHETCEHAGEEGHHHHHKKKSAASPKVNTITETEETVEVTSSSSTPSLKESQQKIKTSDYSSEDNSPDYNKIKSRSILESHQNKQSASSSSMYTTTTTTTSSTNIILKSKKLGGNSLAAATSTPKSNYALESFLSQYASSTGDSLNRGGGRGGGVRGDGGGGGGGGIEISTGRQRLKEVTQNEINAEFERTQREEEEAIALAAANKTSHSDSRGSRRSQNNSNRSFSRFFSNSFGSGEQSRDISDHIAYKEYKRAGEYWKTTPKTDYTYSELSPHRRELAPGVVAMPNMSRHSLENHHERINYMIQRDPTQESYIRRRYESPKYSQKSRETAKLVYDSGDEVDVTQFNDYGKSYMKHTNDEWWFVRILTTVVTTFSSIWQTLSGSVTGADDSALYRTRISSEERGFFGSIGHGISSAFVGFFRYIYLFISSVLSFDTWLLQSSNAESKGKKRFLLLLLILLPLLLLAAWQLLDESERIAYIQRSQSLLPVTTLLASLSQTLTSTGNSLRGFFQLPAFLITTTSSHTKAADHEANLNLYNIQENIQKSLTPEEYENILQHINSYVQQLVEIKLLKQQQEQESKAQLTPQMALNIANVVREQLAQHNYVQSEKPELSDVEVQQIAQKVQLKLEAAMSPAAEQMPLTSAHLAQIRQLIQERIEVNNNHYYTTLEHVDLEALLARILAAPQLAKFIDTRIMSIVDGKLSLLQETTEGSGGTGAQLDRQNLLINELNNEIAFIKLTLADKLSENQDLHQSISNLKLGQDDLLQRMQSHELSTDKRFSELLAEIESKLATLRNEQFTLLNQQIKLSLIDILGFKQATGAKLDDVDLQNWVSNMFVAKEFLEQRLLEINARTNDKIKEEIDRSGMLLMRDISERLKHEILIAVDAKQNESQAVIKGHINAALSEEEVKQLVKNVLAIYDADKTGLVDFALESAGGQILSTRCTENYQTKSAQISVFGIPLWYPTNTPRVAISPNVQPGECWAFQGFPGFLVLKLNSLVYVTGFTLEHIPKSLAPNARIDSAPRNFTVWGLEHEKDQEPVLFGEYEYADNDASLQYFPLQNKQIKRPYEIVELRIESNHGHPAYTCLYRFRVHGKPPAA